MSPDDHFDPELAESIRWAREEIAEEIADQCDPFEDVPRGTDPFTPDDSKGWTL